MSNTIRLKEGVGGSVYYCIFCNTELIHPTQYCGCRLKKKKPANARLEAK